MTNEPQNNQMPPFAAPPPPVSYYGAPPAQSPIQIPPPVLKEVKQKAPGSLSRIALSLICLVLAAVLLAFTIVFSRIGGAFSSLTQPMYYSPIAPPGTFSVISVIGTLQNAGSGTFGINDPPYHHAETIAHINMLAGTPDNAGILLYMDTPGGGVLEGDELYLALQNYKEQTGRPVWAYMHSMCASGGYYVCAATDYIAANRNTITGSIGVYIAMTDTSELYNKLGIETVLIRSGENKGTGMEGLPITQAQRDVYQSMVDEYYEQFLNVVVEGRGISLADLRPLADGRVFTSNQAQQHGLIDEVTTWDEMLYNFERETGSTPFFANFSQQTPLGGLLGNVLDGLPQSDTEAMLSAANRYPVGIPMAMLN